MPAVTHSFTLQDAELRVISEALDDGDSRRREELVNFAVELS